MPADGVVKLTIAPTTETAYIQYPDRLIATVDGVIDAVNTGETSSITYYIPKAAEIIYLSFEGTPSDVTGDLIYNGLTEIHFGGNVNITSIVADNSIVVEAADCTSAALISASKAVEVTVGGCTLLTDLTAPKALTIAASACALTAKSIGDILYAAYVDNRENVNFDFSGGTNADEFQIDTYLTTTYELSLSNVDYLLVFTTNNGTIIINAA